MEPLTVPGNLDSLSAIGQYIVAASADAGLEEKAAYKLRLAVDEVTTNIILHGYEEAGLQGNVYLEAHKDEKSLRIVVEDTAVPYDPTQKSPQDDLDVPLEERQIGGLGVYLAIQGVDAFKYERVGDRNRNIFISHINRDRANSPQ